MSDFTYRYDYSQNQPWTWHGFEMTVDVNKYYTFSFDAFISWDTNIPSTGNTFIANEEWGISHFFYYDNTKKVPGSISNIPQSRIRQKYGLYYIRQPILYRLVRDIFYIGM